MNLDENYDESFIKSFTGIVWTGSSLNIYDNTREIKNQISLMKKLSKLKVNMFGIVGVCNFYCCKWWRS